MDTNGHEYCQGYEVVRPNGWLPNDSDAGFEFVDQCPSVVEIAQLRFSPSHFSVLNLPVSVFAPKLFSKKFQICPARDTFCPPIQVTTHIKNEQPKRHEQPYPPFNRFNPFNSFQYLAAFSPSNPSPKHH